MVAGDGRQAMVEPALQGERAVLGGQILGEVADERGHVGAVEQRRRFAQQRRAGAEAFDDEAELFQFPGALDQRGSRARLEIDDQRAQQDLPDDAVRFALALQLFIDDALVRRVLVDDDQPIARLGEDIGVVHLGARGAERRGEVGV